MHAKIIALLFVVILFAFCCEECEGQGRPFYRPGPWMPKQIIPEGPAWPASVQGYAQNSRRDTTTTRRPAGVSGGIVNSRGRQRQNGASWEGQRFDPNDYEEQNPWWTDGSFWLWSYIIVYFKIKFLWCVSIKNKLQFLFDLVQITKTAMS